MSLKKRKTPLSELFAEREALRKQPIKILNINDKNQKNENSTDYRRCSVKSAQRGI